ncbi:helix-turn-helix domain-containing protein [Yersinia mollaretii]|uniref:helix-turn-helix domain-containing protein n=1 Tax=Yersinia TaxID=629 RepID=UPI00061C9E73|nr:helix-turn-helix transcriptional regulator [Yersinia mollaretii]CNI40671.1 phage repressor protein [Yersinia mollaretii]
MSSRYGEKLKDIRKAEGLTQPEFSSETGVSLGAIRNYETGQRDAGISVIDKIVNHERFKKYALWLMTDATAPESGQISPALSPDGQENISKNQNDRKVG